MKGNMSKADNSSREINSDKSYYQTLVWNGAIWETLLITDGEMVRIRAWAGKNEDMVLQPSWLDKLLRWLGL